MPWTQSNRPAVGLEPTGRPLSAPARPPFGGGWSAKAAPQATEIASATAHITDRPAGRNSDEVVILREFLATQSEPQRAQHARTFSGPVAVAKCGLDVSDFISAAV